MKLTIKDLEYDLPQGRIATRPVRPRSSAKMLVVERQSCRHQHVRDLPDILPEGSLLVVNETSVLPARFVTRRVDTDGRVEGLFLHEKNGHWHVMLKSNGKLRAGIQLEICNGVHLELCRRDGMTWLCTCSDDHLAQDILVANGITPLPPYILSARGGQAFSECEDRENYQTIYADPAQCHSVAAPTAGLHFDDELLQTLEERGFSRVPITLHVGSGTFKGIETEKIEDHEMHEEWWSVSQQSIDILREAKERGRSIIAVGTTSVRTLESLPPIQQWPSEGGLSGTTKLMITPPYDFCLVDGMLTNFHLPKSTLLALVAAMIGIDRLKVVYADAIESGYRFYSFGDAMFFLPQ